MNDPTPVHDNRAAYWVGRILHPYWLPTPTLLLLLNHRPLIEAFGWLALTTLVVLLPSAIAVVLFQRRGYAVHERQTRRPLYLIGLVCVLICLIVLLVLNAPPVLIAYVVSLVVWAPVQAAINAFFTKISAHTAVAAGCATALIITGKVAQPGLIIVLVALVILVAWSRMTTRNHTLTQVVLGAVVGMLPVLIVFPLILL